MAAPVYTSAIPAGVEKTQVRNVGSNYTAFVYNGQTIAFMERVVDSGTPAYSNSGPYEMIHPLGYLTPIEIVTPKIMTGGTLDVTIRELWNQEVWEHLAGLRGANNIADIFRILSQQDQYITCQKTIFPPNGGQSRTKIYHRCVIVAIQDGETVEVGSLSVAKSLTIAYTHTTS